jgi:hypothetical protein
VDVMGLRSVSVISSQPLLQSVTATDLLYVDGP